VTGGWKSWLSGHLSLRCLYCAPDNFPEIPDRSPAFTGLLEINAIEKCSWYLSLKFLSVYFFIWPLDSFFSSFVCAVFSFSLLLFYLLSVFIFYFFFGGPAWAPAGVGWTPQHCWHDLALTQIRRTPVGQGCADSDPLDP